MTAADHTHPKIKEIIAEALRQITETGADSDTAASLLAIAGAMRIRDPAKRTIIARTLAELLKTPTH